MDTEDNHKLVTPGSKIRVDFVVADEAGIVVQTDKNAFEVVIGFRQLLPQIEGVLIGARIGQTKTVKLQSREAFGERDPAKIIEFDRDEFPADVAAGDHFEAEQEDGTILVLSVMEVLHDAVVVDLNHPLAGQCVSLRLTVAESLPATEAELEEAKSLQNADRADELGALLSPERLLRGQQRR